MSTRRSKRLALSPPALTATPRRVCAVSIALFAAIAATAPAQIIFTKADNSDDLNLPTSWIGGTVPGAPNIALWDSTVTNANTVNLGANASWLGLRITNPAGPVTINAGSTLTLGVGGIDLSAATQDLTINAGVTIGNGKQAWNVAAGRTLTLAALPVKPGQPGPNNAGVLQFGTTGTIKAGAATTNLITDNQGNPWATYGLNDWAGTNAGVVVASTYTAATTALTAGVINDVQGDFNVNATVDISALRFNDPLSRSLQISTSASARTLTARGILVTANSGGGTIGGTTASNSSFIRPARTTIANTAFNVIQNSAADFTIGANIANGSSSAAVQLVKSGTGKLILNDAFGHGYTGGTTINEGTLQIGNGGTFGSLGGGDVNNQGSLVFNRSDAITVVNNILGAGSVTQAGPGELSFTTNINTYAGPTNLNGGTLSFNQLANLGTGTAVNFNGGTLKWGAGNTTDLSNRALSFNAAAGINTNGNNVTFSNPVGLGGAGGLTKSGAGTLTLAAANLYTGPTVVSGGTLSVVNAAGSATGTGDLTVANTATLAGTGKIGGSVTLQAGATLAPGVAGAGLLTLGGLSLSGGSILGFDFANPTTFDSVAVTGANGLTINGAGFNAAGWTTLGTYNVLSFSGAVQGAGPSALTVLNEPAGYDYAFGTNGSFVTVTVTAEGVIRNWTATTGGSWGTNGNWDGAAPNTAGATANFGSTITAPATVTLDGEKTVGAITFNSSQSYTIAQGSGGSITLQKATGSGQGIVVSGSHTISAPVILASDLSAEIAGGGQLMLAGAVSGAGKSLTKTGNGTLVLSGTNTYDGKTEIDAGVLAFAALSSLGNGTELALNGGTLRWAAGNAADISARAVTIGAAGATLDTNGNDVALANPIGNNGAGGLRKAGAGTLTLGAPNTYGGSTTISGGTLAVSSNEGLGSPAAGAPVILDGGTLSALGTFSLDNAGANARLITINAGGGTVDVATGQTLTISGVVSGPGALVKTGSGTLAMNSINTYTGGSLLQGGTLLLNNGGALGTGTLVMAPQTTLNFGAVFFGNTIVAPTGAITMGTTAALGGNGYAGVITGGDGSSRVTITGQTSFGAGGNTRQFADTYIGTVEVAGGATLRFSSTSGLNNGGNNATFDVFGTLTARNTGTVNVGALTGSGIVSGASGANTNTSLFIIGAKGIDTTFSGAIIDADVANGRLAAVTKVGAGILTLTGVNTYSGATTVSAGTLLVNGSLSGATTVNGGIFGGSGATGAVTVNGPGTLAPGAGIESLDITGALTMNGFSTFAAEFSTTTSTADLAAISGNLVLDLANSVALSLTDVGGNLPLAPGTSFTLIDYADGGWNGGTFAGLPDDTLFFSGANQFRISYNGNDEATSAVTLLAVPEPGTSFILFAGLGAVAATRRARRRAK